jgi:hypothetical protein
MTFAYGPMISSSTNSLRIAWANGLSALEVVIHPYYHFTFHDNGWNSVLKSSHTKGDIIVGYSDGKSHISAMAFH